jgi:hypothetical protein
MDYIIAQRLHPRFSAVRLGTLMHPHSLQEREHPVYNSAEGAEGMFMDQMTYEREMAVNREAYGRLREQIRRDYAGRYIALAEGRVAAATATYDEAMRAVQGLDPVPECYLVFPADEEPYFEPYYNY